MLDDALADYYEEMAAEGLEIRQFGRVWIHTHPQISADPSLVDERTFSERFGDMDWAVMAIISKTGDHYARLKINDSDIPTEQTITWKVDWDALNAKLRAPFANTDFGAWADELDYKVELPSQAHEQRQREMVILTTPPYFDDQFDHFPTIGDPYGLAAAAGPSPSFEDGVD